MHDERTWHAHISDKAETGRQVGGEESAGKTGKSVMWESLSCVLLLILGHASVAQSSPSGGRRFPTFHTKPIRCRAAVAPLRALTRWFRPSGDVWACPLWMSPEQWRAPQHKSGEIDFVENCRGESQPLLRRDASVLLAVAGALRSWGGSTWNSTSSTTAPSGRP